MTPVYLDSAGHLWSADRAVLHAFARGIGMKLAWFQDRPALYHYDVMTWKKRKLALDAGAVRISPRVLVLMMRLTYAARMSALTDDELDPRPVPGWHLPTEMEAFLAVLRQTRSFGTNDHERVETFATLPMYERMPEGLRDDLRRAGYLG